MKSKIMMIAASAVLAIGLAACATAPKLTLIPPAQLVQKVCPAVQDALTLLEASPLLNAAQKATVAQAHTTNAAVCASGGAVDVTDLQTLNDTLLPALISIVQTLPPSTAQAGVLLGLVAVGPILQQVIDAAIASQAASSAPASSAPSSQPVHVTKDQTAT